MIPIDEERAITFSADYYKTTFRPAARSRMTLITDLTEPGFDVSYMKTAVGQTLTQNRMLEYITPGPEKAIFAT